MTTHTIYYHQDGTIQGALEALCAAAEQLRDFIERQPPANHVRWVGRSMSRSTVRMVAAEVMDIRISFFGREI